MKTDYYTLLDVSPLATEADLKKAYRKKALELHPDKNIHRIEEATFLFAEVQNAYEVLSDPHERAWYDSHKDSILRGDEVETEISQTVGISTEQLMKYFSKSCYNGYIDSNDGFFTIYRDLFNEIISEEINSCRFDNEALESDKGYETISFGFSFSGYDCMFLTADRQETSIKMFYSIMQTFSSSKSFRWMDKYRLSEAPDRQYRRQMERENKRFREQAKKEFNQSVCSLVSFVKKRDPRFKQYQIDQNLRQEEALLIQKQKNIQDSKKKSEMANAFKAQEWARGPSEEDLEIRVGSDGEEYVSYRSNIRTLHVDDISDCDQEDPEEDVIEYDDDMYCIACNKIFSSQQQLENHERSKKHLKNLEILREEMLMEEDNIYQDIASGINSDSSDDDIYISANEEIDSEIEEMLQGHISSVVDSSPKPSPTSSQKTPASSTSKSKRKSKRKSKSKKKEVDLTLPEISDDDFDLMTLSNTTQNQKQPELETQINIEVDDEKIKKSLFVSFDPSSDEVDWTGGKGKSKKKSKKSTSNSKASSTSVNTSVKSSKKVHGVAEELSNLFEKTDLNSNAFTCNNCSNSFPSRSKLFDHINETGHALAAEASSEVGKKKKKNKK